MMLLLPSLRSAWIRAAKLTPLFATRPTPMVAPVPTVELLMAGVPVMPVPTPSPVVPLLAPSARAARSTMLVPVPGKLITPAGTVLFPLPNSSHCTPRSELLLASTSTMMAST